jgi:cytosine/adenosine deaminase-related metal-dependent hydrolase
MSLLIRGGIVLVDASSQPVRADILVHGDRIASIGADLAAGPGTKILEARDRLIIPGLINAHTHAHNHLARAAIDGVPLEIWVLYLGARVAHRTPRDIYVGAALGAIEMAKTGTTCACEMALILPRPTDETLGAVARAYADVGLRVSLGTHISDLPLLDAQPDLERLLPDDLRAEIAGRPRYPTDEVIALLKRMIDRWDGLENGRVKIGIGASAPGRCSTNFLEACARMVSELSVPFQTHLEETKASAVTARQQYGKSSTRRLYELGLLGPRSLLAHGIWLDEDDMNLIAETRSTISHNPISNLKLGSGIAPVLTLSERGCNVAIGTDGSASAESQNLFPAMKLAAILHRVVNPCYDRWPTPADAFRMATLGGARAACFEGQIGAIAAGLKADLVLLDLRSTFYYPRNDLLNQLVLSEPGTSVRTVLVDGRVIVDNGRLTTVDEDALLAEAAEIGERIATEIAGPYSLVQRIKPFVRQAFFNATRVDWPVNYYASEAYRNLE